jgi:hypothetical protein
MFEDVMRTSHPFKDPAVLFETALDVAAVGEHGCLARFACT